MKKTFLLLFLIIPFSIQADQEILKQAGEAYDQNHYQASIHLYKTILDNGDIDGISMYRYAYSCEQVLGLDDELTLSKYAYAKFLLEQEGKIDHKYHSYAENKLLKYNQELLSLTSENSEEILNLIIEEKLFEQKTNPILIYILLVISIISLMVLFQNSKSGILLSLLSIPGISILASNLIVGNMSESTVYMVCGGLLLFMIFSGGYKHARKDGKADRRYKDNPYLHIFSRNVRRNSALVLPVIFILLFWNI